MSKFRSAHRTVVTEIKAFIVDTASRSGVFRQSVSSRVPDDAALKTQDINVSKTRHFDLAEVRGALGILTPEPVRIAITQLRDIESQEPSVPEPPIYTLAVLQLDPTLLAGNALNITLIDPDIAQVVEEAEVTVYNEDTGETNTALLSRVDVQTFVGKINTTKSAQKGNDFNGTTNVEHNQTLRVIYKDRLNPFANDVDVVATVRANSPFVDSVITSLPFVFPDRSIPVLIEDADIAGQGVAHATATNMRTGEVETIALHESAPGIFMGQLPTRTEFSPRSEDAIMDVVRDDQIGIAFNEPSSVTSPTVAHFLSIRAAHPIDGVLFGPEIAQPDASITLELEDYNLAGTETITVPISNPRTGKYVLVQFTENVPNTGQFTGILTLVSSASDAPVGQLAVLENDTVQAVYIDNNSTSGSIRRVEHNIQIGAAQVSPAPTVANAQIEGPNTAQVNSTVEMLVDGLFFLNGQFPGTIRIYGLNDDLTRCSVLHV